MRVLLYIPNYTVDRDAHSLRITRFTDILGSRGWQFDIITTRTFFPRDEALRERLNDLHSASPHLRVFLTHSGVGAALRGRLLYASVVPYEVGNEHGRGRAPKIYRRFLRPLYGAYHYLFGRIGDPDWIVPGALQGLRMLSKRRYQLVFASACFYFASHIAAAIVGRLHDLPLVLDYGDPWGPEPPVQPRWFDRFSEASVVRRARKVIVTNGAARDLLLMHHPFLRPERVAIIPQGYREWLAEDEPHVKDQGSFTIVYTGSVGWGLRSPIEFLKAVQAARHLGIHMKFLWAGVKMPPDEAQRIQDLGLSSVLQDLGHLSHEDALAVQRKATLLLVIGNRSRAQIPGKVIEYIGASRPILCLAEGPGDLAADFVREHGLGIVVANRAEHILVALRELHDLWREGRLETIYRRTNVEEFSWEREASQLERIFLEVTKEGNGARS